VRRLFEVQPMAEEKTFPDVMTWMKIVSANERVPSNTPRGKIKW